LVRSSLNFFEKGVGHEQDLDGWEFGKGALSELRFCGVAVGKRLEVGGKGKVEVKVEAETI
jgi:hypothetical protein